MAQMAICALSRRGTRLTRRPWSPGKSDSRSAGNQERQIFNARL
jgi:hypothetical protein